MVYRFIEVAWYGSILFMLFLILKFSYELITRKKEKYFKTLRLILNFGLLGLYCVAAIGGVMIVVQKPSLEWILLRELKLAATGIGILLILADLNYFYQVKIEKIKTVRPVIRLSLINGLILIFMLGLIFFYEISDWS